MVLANIAYLFNPILMAGGPKEQFFKKKISPGCYKKLFNSNMHLKRTFFRGSMFFSLCF
jgi:hypothetical protein